MWEDVKENAIDMVSDDVNALTYKSLEHIHVFVLANILRRPIVIISDTVVHYPSGSVHESVNSFDGIYLPLLWQPADCVRYPVVLGFASSHFAPLLGMDVRLEPAKADLIDAIPLVKPNMQPRLVHFLHSWNMVEVFLIGTLVSVVKISSMATIALGYAFWALGQ